MNGSNWKQTPLVWKSCLKSKTQTDVPLFIECVMRMCMKNMTLKVDMPSSTCHMLIMMIITHWQDMQYYAHMFCYNKTHASYQTRRTDALEITHPFVREQELGDLLSAIMLLRFFSLVWNKELTTYFWQISQYRSWQTSRWPVHLKHMKISDLWHCLWWLTVQKHCLVPRRDKNPAALVSWSMTAARRQAARLSQWLASEPAVIGGCFFHL